MRRISCPCGLLAALSALPQTAQAQRENCSSVPPGGPTMHQGAVGTEKWTARNSPHIVAFDLNINGVLTLEPCAEVLIAEGKTITVGAGGQLIAVALPDQQVHIGARDPGRPFAQIRAISGGTVHFAYVTIDGGGDPLGGPADVTGTIVATGADQMAATQPTLLLDHVTIAGSRSNGLYLAEGASFAPGSGDLVVTRADQFPMSIWARAVGTVPSGRYTDNEIDEIVLPGIGGAAAVQETAIMRNRGVPYRIGDSRTAGILNIERQSVPPSLLGVPTLVIEAGVKIRVKKEGRILVQRFASQTPAQGALVVLGTPLEPVVFTSAEAVPAAGDWYGIVFGGIPAGTNQILYAQIEYAGGYSQSGSEACNLGTNDAAIRILGPPPGSFVTYTTIVNSAGHGIDRGWRSSDKPDFMQYNTFTSVAGCHQTYPRDFDGSCPRPVPCPK
jgi:hypothetical protein